MAVYPEQYPGALQALANEIASLRRELDDVKSAPARIPVLGADPPASDTTNVWLFPDGRLRWRKPSGVVAEFTPVASPGSSTSTVAKPSVTQPKSYAVEYAALWSQTYKGDDTKRIDDPTRVHFGRLDAANGRQKTLLGFDYAAIQTALTGASVKSVELYLHAGDAYFGDVLVRFAAHTNATAPATYAGQYRRNVSLRTYRASEAKWVTLSTAFGQWLQAGTIKGVGIVQSSDASSEYGNALGVGSSDAPKLRITYVK